MEAFTFGDAFLVMLVGAGPVKAVVSFIALTREMNPATRRRVALTAVAVAGVCGALLLLLGKILQQALHFSDTTLLIAAGIVLLLLAIRMVISQSAPGHGDQSRPANPTTIAVYPLAVPLTLNPIGIVALVTYGSSSISVGQGLVLLAALAIVLAIDVGVYLLATRLRAIPPALISIVETILGILLVALAVELILTGLSDAGVLTGPAH